MVHREVRRTDLTRRVQHLGEVLRLRDDVYHSGRAEEAPVMGGITRGIGIRPPGACGPWRDER